MFKKIFNQTHLELHSAAVRNVFTGLLLGRLLHLDPLQLGEARRLCENQDKKSDDRQYLKLLPQNFISINALHNYTFYRIDLFKKSYISSPRSLIDGERTYGCSLRITRK